MAHLFYYRVQIQKDLVVNCHVTNTCSVVGSLNYIVSHRKWTVSNYKCSIQEPSPGAKINTFVNLLNSSRIYSFMGH